MSNSGFFEHVDRRAILAGAAALLGSAALPNGAGAQQPPLNLNQVLERLRQAAIGRDLITPPAPPPRWQTRPADDKGVLEVADAIIRDMRLGERPQYALLARADKVPRSLMLVEDQASTPQYYVVRYALLDDDPSVARVALLIDAKTGAFKEVTAFGNPMRYLTPQEAINVVAKVLQPDVRAMLQTATVVPVLLPGESLEVPWWEVRVGNRTFIVDHEGVIHGKSEDTPRGGN